MSIHTANSQISQKNAQNGVLVGRPFRTFLVFFCTFWYLVSFWTLELPKWAPIFSPTRISQKLFLNWRPICYHCHDLGRPVGAKAPIVGFLVVDLALDKRWRGWAKPCGYTYIYIYPHGFAHPRHRLGMAGLTDPEQDPRSQGPTQSRAPRPKDPSDRCTRTTRV